MEQLFDNYTNKLAKQYKVENIPWLRLTEAVVAIFIILVLLRLQVMETLLKPLKTHPGATFCSVRNPTLL